MPGDVVVVGSSNTDMILQMDHIPQPGETILGGRFSMAAGGKGANQAVAAARLGAEVSFLSRLGRDPFADMALKTWEEAGVTPVVTQSEDSYTGAAYIFVEESTGNADVIPSRPFPVRVPE